MIKNAEAEDLDALTPDPSTCAAIRESQLASKYADAVVRGYPHVIRQYLGYIDIKARPRRSRMRKILCTSLQ